MYPYVSLNIQKTVVYRPVDCKVNVQNYIVCFFLLFFFFVFVFFFFVVFFFTLSLVYQLHGPSMLGRKANLVSAL